MFAYVDNPLLPYSSTMSTGLFSRLPLPALLDYFPRFLPLCLACWSARILCGYRCPFPPYPSIPSTYEKAV